MCVYIWDGEIMKSTNERLSSNHRIGWCSNQEIIRKKGECWWFRHHHISRCWSDHHHHQLYEHIRSKREEIQVKVNFFLRRARASYNNNIYNPITYNNTSYIYRERRDWFIYTVFIVLVFSLLVYIVA